MSASAREPSVVGADEQSEVDIDLDRWVALAEATLSASGEHGELTLTFVDIDEITLLNQEHMGQSVPTDVLSFPLDAAEEAPPFGIDVGPRLLGDVVICPAIAAVAAPLHAGTLDDELALLVVHGILHVLGHDHVEAGETAMMRARELDLLSSLFWQGPPPAGFVQEHPSQ